MEDKYPGMWQRWFLNQCVAVGWAAKWGFTLEGKAKTTDWEKARKRLLEVKVGDKIIVALKDHSVGRMGEVTGLAFGDEYWEPLVPSSKQDPDGEMGRRINVRWDLLSGPRDRDLIVRLPMHCQFNRYEIRQTICQVRSRGIDDFQSAMNNSVNWAGIQTKFKYESALQAYISTFPHHLEDGFTAHPDLKVRERVFKDRKRTDVLLIDRDEKAVVVECKRDAPSVAGIRQLRHYMAMLEQETGKPARGILVHGGSRNLTVDVRTEASLSPQVQIVRYDLAVDFDPCN